MSEPLLIDRARIRRDGGTQPRAATQAAVIADYAEALSSGVVFPPVVVFFDGTDYWLADGFHRDGAHEALGIPQIQCEVRAGTRRDAVLYAVGANEAHGLRRSNDDKRRAVLILLDDEEWSRWSDREIARRVRVGHPLVAELRRVTGRTSSERTFTTKHGTVSTMDVAAMGRRSADYATIRSADPAALYRVMKENRDAKNAAKKGLREAKERALGEKIAASNAALPAIAAEGRTFGVVYADPAWRPEPYSRVTGMDRAPENHYPTMLTSEIAALPIAPLAARDSVLFIWATMQMLPDAFVVIDAWGFTYKSHAIWVKRRKGNRRGSGYWFTGEHEVLIVATRGKPPCPAPGLQWPSVFITNVGEHSEKPDRVYELIENYYPTVPKLELNARRRRKDWDVWGAEAPDAEPSEAMGRPQPDELDAWQGSEPRAATELPALLSRKRKAA